MIAWFGPAVLLVLLAASNLPERGVDGGSTATTVTAEAFAIAMRHPDRAPRAITAQPAIATAALLPRELPRTRSVRGFGLPSPRAPSC